MSNGRVGKTITFVELVQRLERLRARIQNGDPDQVWRAMPRYMRAAHALVESSEQSSPLLQRFVDDIVHAEVMLRSIEIRRSQMLEKIAALEREVIEAENHARSVRAAISAFVVASKPAPLDSNYTQERRRRSGHYY